MIWRWIKTSLTILSLFVFFLVWTFPFERVGPKIARHLENAVSQALNIPAPRCEILGFGLAIPVGLKAARVFCTTQGEQSLFDFRSLKIVPLPFNQTITSDMGDGSLSISTNATLMSFKPSRVKANFEKVDMRTLTPLVVSGLRGVMTSDPMGLNNFIGSIKLEGILSGSVDVPMGSLSKNSGSADLKFDGLKLPNQQLLSFLGLQDVTFDRSAARLKLSQGKLEIQEFAFLSNAFSTKATGSFQFDDNIDQSVGNIELKWQVVASDALRSSPFGAQLLNAECPNPDVEKFCTKRIVRIQDFQKIFSKDSSF